MKKVMNRINTLVRKIKQDFIEKEEKYITLLSLLAILILVTFIFHCIA